MLVRELRICNLNIFHREVLPRHIEYSNPSALSSEIFS